MLIRRTFASLVLLLGASTATTASTHRVPQEFHAIRAALEAAEEGDTVLVGPGTYRGPDNTELDFNGKNLVVRASYGPLVTVIDCESKARAFYLHLGEDGRSKIEGLTIRSGYSTWGGAGITCVDATPTLQDCRFMRCSGSESGAVFGAMSLEGCSIDSCKGDVAGAALLNGGAALTRCALTGNTGLLGGAIYATSGSIQQCSIVQSSSPYGAVYCVGEVSLADSDVHDNSTAGVWVVNSSVSVANSRLSGNGVALVGNGTNANVSVRNSRITGNGAGIAMTGGRLEILSCELCGNDGGAWGGEGAGVYAVSTITQIRSSLITGNKAEGSGGGLYFAGGEVDIAETTILRNASGGDGSNAYCDYGATATMERVLVWGGCGTTDLFFSAGSVAEITCCALDSSRLGGDGELIMVGNQVASDPAVCDMLDCSTVPSCEGNFGIAGGGGCESPCLARESPCGLLIGARDVGCACTPVIRRTSWGAIRQSFR